jgi:hypothetical protein
VPIDTPAGTPVVGPGAPYITPAILTAATTGISWATIPDRKSSPEQQLAEQLNMCVRATSDIDSYCNQPLRATVDTETFYGPGEFRAQIQPNGVARLLSSRGPVLFIESGRVSSAAVFPPSWSTIAGNQFAPAYPLVGLYGSSAPGASAGGGQAILMAPGLMNWWYGGRLNAQVQVTYVNGWPHSALTAAVSAGASSITVDDITGWINSTTGQGAAGNIYDTAAFQEFVSVTAVTPTTTGAISGPGTLTLATPLVYDHDKGVLVSTLPGNVQLAAIYLCVSQALTRGATATAVQAISGGASGGGPQASGDYVKTAHQLIHSYRRTI